jgi:hypothetical protein
MQGKHGKFKAIIDPFLDMVGVTGSIPVVPTIQSPRTTGNPPLCPKARFVRHFVAEKSGHVVSAREDQPFLATFGRLSPPQKFRSQP